jgi:hypothetical protein
MNTKFKRIDLINHTSGECDYNFVSSIYSTYSTYIHIHIHRVAILSSSKQVKNTLTTFTQEPSSDATRQSKQLCCRFPHPWGPKHISKYQKFIPCRRCHCATIRTLNIYNTNQVRNNPNQQHNHKHSLYKNQLQSGLGTCAM